MTLQPPTWPTALHSHHLASRRLPRPVKVCASTYKHSVRKAAVANALETERTCRRSKVEIKARLLVPLVCQQLNVSELSFQLLPVEEFIDLQVLVLEHSD